MTGFIGVLYPGDDAVKYTHIARDGSEVESYWWFPGYSAEYAEATEELGPEWKEVGYISDDGIDPAAQTDYHAPAMLYTGPLTVTPTGKFRTRPEDVTSICGRTD